jgi:hypothetical protein
MISKDKIFKIFGFIGICSSIISLIIMIVTWRKVDRIEELVDTSRDWIMKLELYEPQSNIYVSGKVERIKGKFEFYTTAVEAHNKGPVNLTMYQNSVDLICYVRPFSLTHSNQPKYYRQSKPIVHQNGDFEGLVVFGNLSKEDLENRYQVIVLAVPKNSVPGGVIHDELPFYLAVSNLVELGRKR